MSVTAGQPSTADTSTGIDLTKTPHPTESPIGFVDEASRQVAEETERRADDFTRQYIGEPDENPFISGVVRALGGAGITVALIIVVLNQVFTLDIVSNSSGPFATSTVTGPMAGALGLLALAILVGGARVVMNQMGNGGGI